MDSQKNKPEEIKVGFCVAYDWELLKISLPLIYPHADSICLSIDKHQKTWSGEAYILDKKAFKSWIQKVDVENKIDIYEDDFSQSGLSAIENDNRQRNMMAARMGLGGWHVQLDCDEYFVDFKGFCDFLKKEDVRQKDVNYSIFLVPVIKKVENGYLLVDFDRKRESVPVASNNPQYNSARRNGYFNKLTPFIAIHETWARDEATLQKKLDSWGHVDDFDKRSYFDLWKSLDSNNYHQLKDFHPLKPKAWPRLQFVPAPDTYALIEHFQAHPPGISKWRLRFRNSRVLAKFKSMLHVR